MTHDSADAQARRKCLRKGLIGLSVVAVVCGTFAWTRSSGDGLLSRVHHGLVVCARLPVPVEAKPQQPGAFASFVNVASHLAKSVVPQEAEASERYTPSMIRLDVAKAKDGDLLVQGTDQPLSDALKAARRMSQSVFLNLHPGTPAKQVAKYLRAAGMRHNAIIAPADGADMREALKADRSVIVAFPVHSLREERAARRLAGRHPYAVYLAPDASSELFQVAHREADVVMTDNPADTTDPGRLQALLSQPVDILVTANAERVERAVDGD